MKKNSVTSAVDGIVKYQSTNTTVNPALKYLYPVKKTVTPPTICDKLNDLCTDHNSNFIAKIMQSKQILLWIDSSNLTSLFRDNNNNVSQILDKSGNNNHLYQTTKINQPKYHNGGLLFNSNQYLVSNILRPTVNYSNLHIVIALKPYNSVKCQHHGILSGLNSNSFDINLFDVKVNSFGVYEISIKNSTEFNKLLLGGRYLSNVFIDFFDGEIYEVIVFNSTLNNIERYNIKQYLLSKWATTQVSRTIPLNNIYTWLDASSASNFKLDKNNNVLSWNDKNFKLNFITNANSKIKHPNGKITYDTNKVIFDGLYMMMKDTIGLNLNNCSIFYVFEQSPQIENAVLLSSNNRFTIKIPLINVLGLEINKTNLNYVDPDGLSKKLYEFNINNGIGILYVNGAKQGTVNFSNNNLGIGNEFKIGPLNANIYEIIILNKSSNHDQRNQIYSYLTEKWNLSITYELAPNPTFWIDSNNSKSIVTDSSNNIISWSDLSSNKYPIIINDIPPTSTSVNGLNYAFFNNSNLQINLGMITGDNLTLYLVFSASNLNDEFYNRLISFSNGESDYSDTSFNINSY